MRPSTMGLAVGILAGTLLALPTGAAQGRGYQGGREADQPPPKANADAPDRAADDKQADDEAAAPRRGMGRGPGGGGGPGMGQGRGMGRGPGGGGPGGGGGAMREVMNLIHSLLDDHLKIERKVEDIPGGVLTVTTSKDPKVTERLRTHVRQMKQRAEQGLPIRMWDPLFVELLKHADDVTFVIEDVEGGVRVTMTSEDAYATRLIRQHAHRGVSEFVKDGWDRVHEETPLPEEPKAERKATKEKDQQPRK